MLDVLIGFDLAVSESWLPMKNLLVPMYKFPSVHDAPPIAKLKTQSRLLTSEQPDAAWSWALEERTLLRTTL